METFQKLKIYVPRFQEEVFFNRLGNEILISKWKMRNDLAENYKKYSFSKDTKVYCIESEQFNLQGQTVQGIVWMWNTNDYFEVFNITPNTISSLSYYQYNYILNFFYDRFIRNIVSQLNIRAEITSAEKFLIESIGSEAFSALELFSKNANKTTGNTHPYDFNRWCEFVFIIFRKRIELNADELIDWFEDSGWSEEMATQLGLDFEYSIDLLTKYEQY